MKHTPAATTPAAAAPPPALVIAGHGTRDQNGAATSLALVDHVRELLPDVRVEAGFVELTPPTIADALAEVLADHPRAVVVPLMIGAGGHLRDDIPEAVEAVRQRHPGATMVTTRHLGAPQPLIAAALQRIDAARGEWEASQTTVIFVGRGCSITAANADHVRLARVLQEQGGYRSVLPAFIQVTPPAVPQALAEAYAVGARHIVVMPHYLFPGRLESMVHEHSTAFAAAHPDGELRIADVIGACPELAQVVAQRYREGALQARRDLGSPAYLSGLLLAGRKVVAAGGGCVNRRRVPALIDAGADVTVVSPTLHPALQELADQGRFRWEPRTITETDLDGAWYVMAATDDPDTNAGIVEAAEARHTFCVRADDATHGSAWTPASGNVSGATIAVLTDHDPRRAARLRDQIVEFMGDADA
ncbi:MAG: CbiX/SirB N-terminal domain-containing protein [Arachnia sp.]